MEETARAIEGIRVQEFQGSRYVRPQTVSYDLEGTARTWDMIKSMGSVAVVLYHRDLDSVVLVRQFRPPVWASQIPESGGGEVPGLEAGFTYELCAGLIDKSGLTPAEIAREEIAEECGYEVALGSIARVTTYTHATAHLGSREDIFYAEIDESMRNGEGGGLSADGEAIEVLALPLRQAREFVLDPAYPKSAALIMGIQWLVGEREKKDAAASS
ncbi:uridine diphosphate glucose pyrophosphatase [Chloropicon primus]|nr:uridine diphosphate glucose pyrophosphatase [Chloropicon primus]